MPTPVVYIVFILIVSLLGALGQYLYVSGAELAGDSVSSYQFNLKLLSCVVCYIVVMELFVAAFKKGGALTVLHPIYATTFMWAALIAPVVYGTPIKPVSVGGMTLLVVGM